MRRWLGTVRLWYELRNVRGGLKGNPTLVARAFVRAGIVDPEDEEGMEEHLSRKRIVDAFMELADEVSKGGRGCGKR